MSPQTKDAPQDQPNTKGINILIFDGGRTGTTEYSSLRILHEIISRRAYDMDVEESELKPCDVFDMFCGTGMGGVFAILLGRLRLSVQDVIAWYIKVFTVLFLSEAWQAKDSDEASKLFSALLKDIPSAISLDDFLVDKASSKAFTCTVNPINLASVRLLRTYRVRSNASPMCTIRDALQASIADQIHLPAPEFGFPVPEAFCSAIHGFNNPTGYLLEELPSAFGKGDMKVASITNLGTGHPGVLTLSSVGPSFEELGRLARDSEQMARTYNSKFEGLDQFFFRLSVDQGFQPETAPPNGCREKQLGIIQSHTASYLKLIKSVIDRLVNALTRRSGVESCNRLGSLTGPYAKDKLTGDVCELRQDVQMQINDQQRRDIRDWLLPTYSLEDELEDLYKQGCGSGQWLLNSDEMTTWIAGGLRLLVLTGPPGCGKTTLSALVDNFVRHDSVRRVLTIIIKYSSKMTIANIFERLAVQLFSVADTVPTSLLALYAERRRSDDKLKKALASVFDGYQAPVYLILDALDEFTTTNPREVIDVLLSLSQHVQLFVTSRPLPDTVFNFASCKVIRMESSNSRDLNSFIKSKISDFNFKPTAEDTAFLESKVLDSSQGIYLLAAFNVRLLSECMDTYSALSEAEYLPHTAGERYEASMDRIKSKPTKKRETAVLALTWIMYAKRPLTLEELRHAVACTKHNLSGREIQPALMDPSTLLAVCDGLAVDRGGFVTFVHFTAQTYFENTGSDVLSEYLHCFSIGCLRYLNAKHSIKDVQSLWECATRDMSFFEYCACYWGDHPHVDALVSEFNVLCANQDLFHSSSIIRRRKVFRYAKCRSLQKMPSPTFLHIAASFGLDEWILRLCDQSQVNSTDSQENTPLHYAALAGQAKAIKVLISWPGIDLNFRNKEGHTSLFLASDRGHLDVIRALLETEGIDVNSPNKYEITPLSIASCNGHFDIVRALLKQDGVDINAPGNDGSTPLSLASVSGHLDIVRALLEQDGVDINAPNNDGSTPLSLASASGHLDIVRALLEKEDINVNTLNVDGVAPVVLASVNGHFDVVRALLQKEGIDVNTPNKFGITPLSEALFKGHLDVARALLEKEDIDVNSRDRYGDTPLFLAFRRDYLDIVRALLGKKGIDVNSPNKVGRTPLSFASSNGHLDIVRILLKKKGINVNCREEDGSTPLSLASTLGYLDVVKVLLEKEDIDVNALDFCNRTPLHKAASNGYFDVVQALLEKEDINVNTLDFCNRTSLSRAASNGDLVVVRALLEVEGIEVSSPDVYGETPLFRACFSGHLDVVRALLAHDGSDVNNRNKYGDTPLSYASRRGYSEIVRALQERGAS